MKPTPKDIVLTRRLAQLADSSVLRVPDDAKPRPLTEAECTAAAAQLLALADVVRRCTLAQRAARRAA